MPGILNHAVESCIYSLLPAHAVVSETERYAAKHDVPIIGPAVARILYFQKCKLGSGRLWRRGGRGRGGRRLL
jgi:hypothetical protein